MIKSEIIGNLEQYANLPCKCYKETEITGPISSTTTHHLCISCHAKAILEYSLIKNLENEWLNIVEHLEYENNP